MNLGKLRLRDFSELGAKWVNRRLSTPHIIRNGEEVVRSLQDIQWAPSGLLNVPRNTLTWMSCVRAARAEGNRIGSAQYMELRYEDVVANPRAELERMCSFLGEPFDERMLEFHKGKNSTWGITSRPFPGPNQEPPRKRSLNIVERQLFRVLASGMMRDLGYYK